MPMHGLRNAAAIGRGAGTGSSVPDAVSRHRERAVSVVSGVEAIPTRVATISYALSVPRGASHSVGCPVMAAIRS
jgi:hypothetical protein